MGRSVRQETEMIPAIGLARQKFTAQVAATVCRASHALPVKQGEEPAFLASRSLSFLPLEKEMVRRLRLLGVYTMGQLTGLSLPALQEQFGPQITPFYHLARGEEAEPVHAPPPELSETCAFIFDDGVANLQVIHTVAGRLVAKLAHRLQTKSLQARIVRLLVDMEEDPSQQRQLTLRQPSGSASRLGTAVQELINSEPFPSPVSSIKIVLPHLVPAQARQLALFETTALSPHARRTIDNLAVKYRQSHFFQPQTADIAHPLPERRFHLQALVHDALVA
jgi:nucleotidyltransferase/DNA polymerase involved in DNA repair